MPLMIGDVTTEKQFLDKVLLELYSNPALLSKYNINCTFHPRIRWLDHYVPVSSKRITHYRIGESVLPPTTVDPDLSRISS